MKTFFAAAAAAASIFSATTAQCQEPDTRGAYATLGYAALDAGVNLGAIEARLGYRLNRWLGVEAEGAVGVDGEVRSIAGPTPYMMVYDLEYKAALYGVGFLPLGPRTELLGRIGYGTTRIDHNAHLGGHDQAESWNFGVGAQHRFDDANGLRIDYTRQERDAAASGGHVDVWSVAYTRRF